LKEWELGAIDSGFSIIREDLGKIVDHLGDEIQRFSGKTVLITGANGFLPSYLADTIAFLNEEKALSRPAHLLVLVRSELQENSRLGHLLERPNIEFIFQDVCQPLVYDRPIHFLIHAASLASPQRYRDDPIGVIDANSLALRQLLAQTADFETESFLYFSSSEIYGNPDTATIPTPETYVGKVDCLGARACYAESKRFGETLCAAFFEQQKTPAKIVRPFHIYGPGLRIDDGRIVAEMIRQGLINGSLELLSDGKATRTYCYVADATIGFFKVLLGNNEGEAFNVGADCPETSVLELATIISGLLGIRRSVKINASPKTEYLKGAPDRVCPDLQKIRNALGYQPFFPLEKGLKRTIDWFRSRKKVENHEP
jgi:UDP-glucuronate decarboxylase